MYDRLDFIFLDDFLQKEGIEMWLVIINDNSS